MSIREIGDGTILLKCWAGCGAADVMAAVGLSLADLFPRRPDNHHTPGHRGPWRDAAGEAFRALAGEVDIIHVAGDLTAHGITLSAADRERLALAVSRVNDALATINGGRRHVR